jgi:hypothetical protein
VRRKAAHITKDGSKIQGKAGALPNVLIKYRLEIRQKKGVAEEPRPNHH